MDFYTDKYLQIFVDIKDDLPEFVKKASVSTQEELQSLPDIAFADKKNRELPINSKANTFLSSIYFVKSSEDKGIEPNPIILKALVKAAYIQNIEEEVLKLFDNYSPKNFIIKYAIDKTDTSFGDVKHFNISTPNLLKKATANFTNNYIKFPIEWRVEISKNIIKQANAYNIILDNDLINTYGEAKACNRLQTAASVGSRVNKVSNSEHKMFIVKLAKAIRNTGLKTIGEMTKTASVLLKFDRLVGLDSYYKQGLKDPYQTVFNLSIKQAEEIVAGININGKQYNYKELEQIPVQIFTEALGEDFAESILDEDKAINLDLLKDISPTLPKPEAKLLQKYMDTYLEKKGSFYDYSFLEKGIF